MEKFQREQSHVEMYLIYAHEYKYEHFLWGEPCLKRKKSSYSEPCKTSKYS
jgi:hypothetical protein